MKRGAIGGLNEAAVCIVPLSAGVWSTIVSELSEESGDVELGADAPVLIFIPSSNEEAEVVRATLDAAGIATSLQGYTVNPYLGALDAPSRDAAAMGIYVPPSQVEAAKAVLSAVGPTEEELTAEEEADPRTLEEAEAEVKNA